MLRNIEMLKKDPVKKKKGLGKQWDEFEGRNKENECCSELVFYSIVWKA